jgi:hypothetical protein
MENNAVAQLTAYRLIIGEIYARKERYPLSVDAEQEIAVLKVKFSGDIAYIEEVEKEGK